LHILSLLTFARSRSKFKVKTAVLKIFHALAIARLWFKKIFSLYLSIQQKYFRHEIGLCPSIKFKMAAQSWNRVAGHRVNDYVRVGSGSRVIYLQTRYCDPVYFRGSMNQGHSQKFVFFWGGYKSFWGWMLLNSRSDVILPHKMFTSADFGGYKYRYPPPSLRPCYEHASLGSV